MRSKEEARASAVPGKVSGRAVELLRGLASYRAAKRVLVSPAAGLRQVRVNALTDGKELLVPTPGLKEGFYLLKPYETPFKRLNYAVGYTGLLQYGQRVVLEDLSRAPVSLLVTDCLAVDQAGYFVGDGKGLLDLAVAILVELGGLAPAAEVFALGEDQQLVNQELEHGAWDVRLNGFITSSGIALRNSAVQVSHRVLWDLLAPRRIRKITPLWKMRAKIEQDAAGIEPTAP